MRESTPKHLNWVVPRPLKNCRRNQRQVWDMLFKFLRISNVYTHYQHVVVISLSAIPCEWNPCNSCCNNKSKANPVAINHDLPFCQGATPPWEYIASKRGVEAQNMLVPKYGLILPYTYSHCSLCCSWMYLVDVGRCWYVIRKLFLGYQDPLHVCYMLRLYLRGMRQHVCFKFCHSLFSSMATSSLTYRLVSLCLQISPHMFYLIRIY